MRNTAVCDVKLVSNFSSALLGRHRKTNTCFSGGIYGLPKGFPKGILPVLMGIISLANNSMVV